jgi:hypothetical protein
VARDAGRQDSPHECRRSEAFWRGVGDFGLGAGKAGGLVQIVAGGAANQLAPDIAEQFAPVHVRRS